MNDTITTPAPVEAEPQLVWVDADTVQIENNVRTEADLDPVFLNSVKTHGVLMPVRGFRDADGQLWVRMGQMRTLAARATGKKLPIMFYEASQTDAEPAWFRAVEQLAENDHRNGLTAAQHSKAWRQMELDGLSPTKIAGVTGMAKEQVKAGLTVAKSEAISKIAAEANIDLLQLAAMTEFEDDAATTEELLQTALDEPDQFDHALSRARQVKERRLAVEARRAELEGEGKTTVDASELNSSPSRPLSELVRDENATVDPELGDGIVYVVKYDYYGGLTERAHVLDFEARGYSPKPSHGSTAQSGPMTEAEKAARRKVIACNKAWDAAEPVRADWLVKFLSRKALPKDAASVIAIAFTRYGYEMREHGDHLAHQLLGIEEVHGGRHVDALASLVEANPTKAGLVMLALTLGKMEAGTSRNTWRSPTDIDRYYLQQVRSWGYPLSPVELIAIGEAEDLPDTGERVSDFDLEELAADAQEDGE